MNPHSATLLRALATLHVAQIRFTITRDGDAQHHSTPRARIDGVRTQAQPFAVLSVENLFEAYALTPRKAEKAARVTPKIARPRATFGRRHEKLAA